MKLLIVFLSLASVAIAISNTLLRSLAGGGGLPFVAKPVVSVAKPIRSGAVDDPKVAVILRYDSDNIGVDGYNYNVETSDGQSKQEQGQLINPGTENEAITVRGQFSYVGPDGVTYTVTYVADENGFQPQGAHLPVAP